MLLVCLVRHYGWAVVDPAIAGIVSKTLGAIAAICLVVLIACLVKPRGILLLVITWYMFEELQIAVCGSLYMYMPWEVAKGQPLCSSLAGFDFGSVGIFAAASLVYALVNKDDAR